MSRARWKIAANARQLREHPNVRQAQQKATTLLSTGTDAATAKLHHVAVDTAPDRTSAAAGKTRPTPRKPTATPMEPAVEQPLI